MSLPSRRTDRLALAVFERAQGAGEPVSMPLVKQVIAELDEGAEAPRVYAAASFWERSIDKTRRHARR